MCVRTGANGRWMSLNSCLLALSVVLALLRTVPQRINVQQLVEVEMHADSDNRSQRLSAETLARHFMEPTSPSGSVDITTWDAEARRGSTGAEKDLPISKVQSATLGSDYSFLDSPDGQGRGRAQGSAEEEEEQPREQENPGTRSGQRQRGQRQPRPPRKGTSASGSDSDASRRSPFQVIRPEAFPGKKGPRASSSISSSQGSEDPRASE